MLCKEPTDLLCPLILYLDKLTIDAHGHLSLEPLYFTLGLFNCMTHNKREAWHPLGYIPNLYLLSKSENEFRLDSIEKLQLCHEILDSILASLVKLQKEGGIPFTFHYQGRKYCVSLKGFVLVVLGDTEGHDHLCAQYNCRNLGVACLCHHCDIPTAEINNAFYPWSHTMPGDIQDLIVAGDVAGLKSMLQHNVQNAFLNGDLW